MWHPALLQIAQAMPSWLPAEEPPPEPAQRLILLPECSRNSLPDPDWPRVATEQGGWVVDGWSSRDDLIATLLKNLDHPPDNLHHELVAGFLALGFCHFQVELLTRQLRYMSNLDEESFQSELLLAVDEIFKGDVEAARRQLESTFELLHEAREYFYPVEAHLLDLTLVAPTTLGNSLRGELADGKAANLMLSGEMLRQMARQEPATCKALADALKSNTATLVGGEYLEAPLPLLPPEAIRRHLQQGISTYENILGVRPTVFGRRRFGLTPVLPQILKKFGFIGAIHCAFDDGRFPVGNQSRIVWQGADGTPIEAIGRIPMNIDGAAAFLSLPEQLGGAMDLDHVATAVFAHWPGRSSTWYHDLRRVADYSPVVGVFSSITDYFEESQFSSQEVKYTADQYRSPYLQQDVAAGRDDPISRWVRYYHRRAIAEAVQTLEMLTAACGTPPRAAGESDRIDEVENSITTDSEADDRLDERLQSDLDDAIARFSESLTGSTSLTGSDTEVGKGIETGYLAANPWSFPRRVRVETPELANPPEVAEPVRATDGESAVVDVPAMGFAWVGPGPNDPAEPDKPAKARKPWWRKQREEPPMTEENVLRNEFAEVTLDPHTGALSIADYYSRGPRIAQQVALRTPQGRGAEPDDDSNYSVMAADEITVTQAGPIVGEIVCRGRLVDRNVNRLAGFVQTTRLWRGSRIVEVRIDLDIEKQPETNPWASYYAARFAWDDATSDVFRSVNMASVPTEGVRLEAPHFIDIRSGKSRTTLLTGGLPYHRRFGPRKVDMLLAVRGEAARSFRFGIGIDLPAAMPAAIGFLAPETVVPAVRCPPAKAGWWFHLDSRNVIATYWEPIFADDSLTGFRVRVLQTENRRAKLGLRSFRLVKSAAKIRPGDDDPLQLPVDADRITVDLGPYEWAEVEAEFG